MLNMIYYYEIRKICNEIADANMDEGKTALLKEAYDNILKLNNIVRTEGLLALEEYAEKVNEDFGNKFMQEFCEMVLDGTDAEDIKEIGITKYMSLNLHSYDALIYLLYFRGFLLIQEGANLVLIEKKLQAMMPYTISATIILKKEVCGENENNRKERIEKLCEGGEIDHADHSICGQTAITLCEMKDHDVQLLLKDIDRDDLFIAMKGLPGKARKRIFDNVSQSIGEMIAEDMEYTGPVRMCDVEECCYKLMNHLIILEKNAQVSIDVTAIKVVLDIYRSNSDRVKEMKDKYRKLKSIIDDIM